MNMLSDTEPRFGADTIRKDYGDFPWPAFQIDSFSPLWGLHVMWDIDDCVMPWARPVHEAAQRLGFHDGTRDWTSWSMWEDLGYTKTEWLEAVTHASANGLYETPPYDGAVDAAQRLFRLGVLNHVVTARGFMADAENIRRWTDVYLEVHRFPWHTRTFARNKAEAMEAVLGEGRRFDYAVDDSIKNYEVLDAAGVRVYLLTQPHNIHETVPDDRRVASAVEFVDAIITRETR